MATNISRHVDGGIANNSDPKSEIKRECPRDAGRKKWEIFQV